MLDREKLLTQMQAAKERLNTIPAHARCWAVGCNKAALEAAIACATHITTEDAARRLKFLETHGIEEPPIPPVS